jgi:hypothetical protein
MVLLGCNADDTETLPPLVNGKYNKPYRYRIVKKLATKYTANSNSWMTSATFGEFLVQLDYQRGAKSTKILKLYIYPQIAQAICHHWIWGSSILSNASAESNSYGRPY